MRTITDLLYGRGAAKFESNESFQPIFQSWSMIGITTLKSNRTRDVLHMCFCWFCILLSPFSFYMGYVQTLRTKPITDQLSLLQAIFNVTGLPLKAIFIKISQTHLRTTEAIFVRLDERCQSAESREQIKKCVVLSARIFTVVGSVYHLYGSTTILQAFFTDNYPLQTWLPFTDYIPQPTIKYYSHFMFEVFHIYFLLTVQFTNDVFPAIYIRNLRTHMNLLTERVSRLGSNPEFTDDQNFNELVDCIATHQDLLVVKDIVESVCSVTVFIEFVAVATAHCICMLNFFVFADRFQQMVILSYYLGVIMQIMPVCYQASMIMEDSAKLPDAIFHCNWLAMDKRSRKLIIYFIHRAQENMTFVALKLFKIDMTTNLSIVKFAFTLYTFMNNMGFGQNMKELLE
ncbi:odorant receptor 43b-like [Zeugodacus cucurbitae]|uniref:odorant receptor 43b-like n=1 Tax=Zeugodacus cucurbitae TaxID=28588 RepID=UPI0010A74BF9|nr:odorant receptor 43b-like [Zeugodacus cucurbitae]